MSNQEMFWSQKAQSGFALKKVKITESVKKSLEFNKKLQREYIANIQSIAPNKRLERGRVERVEQITLDENGKVTTSENNLNRGYKIVYLKNMKKSTQGFVDTTYPDTVFLREGTDESRKNNTLRHELAHSRSAQLSILDDRNTNITLTGFTESVDYRPTGRLLEEWWAMSHETSMENKSKLYVRVFNIVEAVVLQMKNIDTNTIQQIFEKYSYSEKYIQNWLSKWQDNNSDKKAMLMDLFEGARYTYTDRMVMRDLFNGVQAGLFDKIFEANINYEDLGRLEKLVKRIG